MNITTKIRNVLFVAALVASSPASFAVHIDVVVGQVGGQLTANFCADGSPGCESLSALSVIGIAPGTLPQHGATGETIFVTEFDDFAGGPFGTDDPGFFSGAGALPADTLMRYVGLGNLQYWDKTTATWSNNTPGTERVRLTGGFDVTIIEDSSSCDGLIICIPDTTLTFEESSTLFTTSGVAGVPSLVIDNTAADGSLHTHLDWFVEQADETLGGAEGAYLVQLAMRMDGLDDSDPFLVLFNRGLSDTEFAAALLALIRAGDDIAIPPGIDPFDPPDTFPVIDHVGGDLDVARRTVFNLDDAPGATAAPFALRTTTLTGRGTVDLVDNQLLIQPTADSTFEGIVIGTGDVIVQGSGGGRLLIDGLLGQTGWTSVESGTLGLVNDGDILSDSRLFVAPGASFDIAAADGTRSVGALNGDGLVNLGANTLRIGDGALLAEFTGTITGTGGITKVGPGEQRLLGIGAYTGETRIESGRLTAVPDAISDTVFNEGTLNFEINDDSTYGGTITGSGILIKSGASRLSLTGSASHTGGTQIEDGTLELDASALTGAIENAGTVHFLQSSDGVFAGDISGSGQLVKSGSGKLRLTGTNTYSGGSFISGPLELTNDASLGDKSGDLTLDDAHLYALAPLNVERTVNFSGTNTVETGSHNVEISGFRTGTGTFSKFGTGTLTLSGESHASTTIDIMEGVLRLQGQVGGDLRLAGGTTLTGRGEIGGDLLLQSGSSFNVNLAPGYADTLTVGGRAQIDGAALQLNGISGDYPIRSLFPLITAGGGVTGSFSSVTSNLAFLDHRLDYDDNSVLLHLTRNDATFTDFAGNSTLTGAARALDAMLTDPHGDAMNVLQGLQTLTSAQVPEAIETVSGLSSLPVPSANQAQSRAVIRQISTRLRGLSAATSLSMDGRRDGQILLAANDGNSRSDNRVLGSAMQAASTLNTEFTHGVWVRAVAGFGDFDLPGGAKADADNAGVLFGYDVQIAEKLTAGLFGLYYDAEVNQDGPDATTTSTGWQAGGYARYESARWYVDLIGSYGFDEFDSQRSLALGPLRRNAMADFDGESANVYVELGRAFSGTITLEPFVGLGWSSNWRDSYTETGAGALGLIVGEETTDSVRSLLGVRARYGFLAFGARESIIEFRGAWAHEFDDPSAFTARFLGDASNTRFRVSADDAADNSAILGASMVAQLGQRAEAFVDFNAEIDKRQNFWSFGTGVRVTW